MKNSIQSGKPRRITIWGVLRGKILILGAKGMLGGYLGRAFLNFNPVLWDKEDLDITNREEVNNKIKELQPNIIINAAAYTAVDDCEANQDLAMKVNGEAVKYLVEAMNEDRPHSKLHLNRNRGLILFIHYSTDYVFDGKKQNGYKENDEPHNSINAYGESKLLGEKYILDAAVKYPNFKYYLIRTSWLYGRGGKNFVDAIAALLKKSDRIKVVDDQRGKPTYAYDLAIKTRELLEGNYASGIYHITNETENREKGVSWYDFANEIFRINREKIGPARRQAGENKEIMPCTSGEFPRPAKRPKWAALINTKLPLMRNWRGALKEYLSS